jgi:hypothetical protein
MFTVRYARPRLITEQDRRYRAHIAHFMLQKNNHRAIRPPRQRDIFGSQAEEALRDWLASRLDLAETRILEYEERRGRRATTKYREIDALVLEDRRSARVFEIKASRKASSLSRALGQLRETRDILRLIYPTVYLTILLVDTGIPTSEEIADLMTGPEPPAVPPQTLDDVLDDMPHVHQIHSLDECNNEDEKTAMLRFTVDDIIALVGAENLALDWEADEEAEETPPAQPDFTPAYSTDDADNADDDNTDTDNPLAAALRRAGLSNE